MFVTSQWKEGERRLTFYERGIMKISKSSGHEIPENLLTLMAYI